jgi:Domain of unknown function (DUF4262)
MTFDTFTDSLHLDIATRILRYGYTNMSIGGGQCSATGCTGFHRDDQPWSYTIGMVDNGLPELVTTGLSNEHVVELAGAVWAEHRAGRTMSRGDQRQFGPVSTRLDEVPVEWLLHDQSRMAMWVGYYGPGRARLDPPSIRQIVWSDSHGRFPDDPQCDPEVVAQQALLAVEFLRYPRRAPRRNRRPRTRQR